MKCQNIFLTFGGPSQHYRNRVLELSRQARNLDFFHEIRGITDKDLIDGHHEFYQKHGNFLNDNSRGYGFWLWKPYIVLSTLYEMNDGDFLFYLDSGCSINNGGKERIQEYINMIKEQSEFDILSFQMDHLQEVKYTKRELLNHLNTDIKDMNSGQCLAGILIFRKGKHSIKVVEEWYRLASIPHLINDERNDEYRQFVDHRHDQSIYSLLVKKYGSLKIPDETYFEPEWEKNGRKYPFWATRIKLYG